MSDIFVRATDIRKTFKEGSVVVEVLKGVSLQLRKGEVISIEGPSGSGKTTLLSIIGSILTPTSGEFQIGETQVHKLHSNRDLAAVRRKYIGFVFQQYNLFPALTARENVEYALNIRGVGGKKATSSAIESLENVGLRDRLDFLPRDLSGGQKQRVAIARALASRPPLLLADEPTANLDSQSGAEILQLFQKLAWAEGCAVMIVTHDHAVRKITDRTLTIRDGNFV